MRFYSHIPWMINFDQILENLFVGGCPRTDDDIELLQHSRISAVLNLQRDEDFVAQKINWNLLLSSYQKRGIQIQRLEIIDFDEEDFIQHLPEAMTILSDLISQGHTVYVHCTAGSERSPSVVTSYLAWYDKRDSGNMGLEKALAFVKARRRCSPYEDALKTAGQRYGHKST